MSDFASLRKANKERQAEWDRDDRIGIVYRSNELAGEVGEACNVVKKLERERLGIRGSRATTMQLADELADVLICVDLVAMEAGIDLWSALCRKFNATSEKNDLKTRLESGAPRPTSRSVTLEAAASVAKRNLMKDWGATIEEADAIAEDIRALGEP